LKKQALIYLLVATAVCCIWFFVAYVPFHKGYGKTMSEISSAEHQLEDFQKTIAELPGFIERQKNLRLLRDDFNSRLYSKNDVLKLFATLRKEASQKNVSLVEITPPVEELLYLNSIIPDSSRPQFLNISLNLEGDYINFGKFIDVVEHADYFRGINLCKMYGHADDKSKITMQFGFKALLGSLKEEG
jgi:hypothetical protein